MIFGKRLQRISSLLQPLSTGKEYCEGDEAQLSIMPRIWQHITARLTEATLLMWGFPKDVVPLNCKAVTNRRKMNMKPITLACKALDPRFCGDGFSVSEWDAASGIIMKVANDEGLNRSEVLSDLVEFRSKSGVFGGL